MAIADLTIPHLIRPQRLTICLAIACALAASAGVAQASASTASRHASATRHVTDCSDDGSAGTLRTVIADAHDGDTIDLSALTCSTITLRSGAIVIALDDLTLTGPGTSLTIDGNYQDSLFEHTGSGTLAIDDLTLTRGFKYRDDAENADGGCIFSAGSVSLTGTRIIDCVAAHGGPETNYSAIGGAIYAEGDVTLIGSIVTQCEARAGDPMQSAGGALGGGINALGRLTMIYSTLSYNLAVVTGAGAANDGGAFAYGGFDAKYSTISNNEAYSTYDPAFSNGGGISAGGDVVMHGSIISGNAAAEDAGLDFVGGTATITNSTISDNHALVGYGGLTAAGPLNLSNSTIAFNEALGSIGGGGLVVLNGQPVTLESTIIANNTSAGRYAADIDTRHVALVIAGSHSLVGTVGTDVTLPVGTLRSDPLLGPLRDNGGLTRTHALLPGSPAIDAGSDAADLDTDQRGGSFPRVVGAAADIGAFETNPDVIFVTGFD